MSIPPKILIKMLGCKAHFERADANPGEAAAARAIYDDLVARYGNPDPEPVQPDELYIYRPENGWYKDVKTRNHMMARNVFDHFQKIGIPIQECKNDLGGPAWKIAWCIGVHGVRNAKVHHHSIVDDERLADIGLCMGIFDAEPSIVLPKRKSQLLETIFKVNQNLSGDKMVSQ